MNTETLVQALPSHLAERCRALNALPAAAAGEFVLYWMHHAVRADENPALDVAIDLGNRLSLPVLVYQGLGGDHPFNNDRHHSFILQGARDAHDALERMGVRAAFHLDRSGRAPSPLRDLARRAGALVVEDFAAPPFPAWTRKLAGESSVAVLAVDCACLVPMRLQPRRFKRAFEYRRHNQAEIERRLPLTWPSIESQTTRFPGPLGFESLDLESADIPTLCAECAIDHGVPPIAHTPGGSEAGYVRWHTFLHQGLKHYARTRNDAASEWPRGVSRISPYLHHGQISPFRVAREAWQHGGKGAEKFLDELLVWRELAFNFCFHSDDPERLEVLPEWAQQTLQRHTDDPRPKLIDDETLARSCSGDELWDLAQDSLRIHGELHNNLRMTWAKAIPQWRPSPQAALQTLIELNHRYALDGSDPNSYGGLLWSLGLFDRPFPESPVLGQVRSRSTAAHAKRLDLTSYRDRVRRPSSGQRLRIAVIGAGIAGLSAARTLHDQGHAVEVFEKGRGRGGRAATRRVEGLAFDHGAQYFTARDPGFRRTVDAWRERGLVDLWPLRIGRVVHGEIQASPDQRDRFVGVPGMSALGRHLAEDLELHTEIRVLAPLWHEGKWRLDSATGVDLGEFDALIVSAPAPQAAQLLASAAPELAAQATAIEYEPTWAVMLAFDRAERLATNGLFFASGPLSWAAENSSKPGRANADGLQTWVLHAAPEWTRARLGAPVEQVTDELTDLFCKVTELDPDGIRYREAKRWLYSLVANPLQTGALWKADRRLGVCGDWCAGSRVEGAYLSGQAVAGRLLGQLASEGRKAATVHSSSALPG